MTQKPPPKFPPLTLNPEPPDRSTPPVEVRSSSYYEQERLRAILGEAVRRRAEALRLYEPLPSQDRFHRSTYQERLLRGSNRGGKTLPAAVEVARAVTCQDPHGKYPETGLCVCVGKDGSHCADPMWKKLARPGAFSIIRDVHTGLWRAYRAYDPGDLARAGEAKPAPPLIPPRYIKSIAWEEKKANQPKKITLHTGWEILFKSSEGKPPQGITADLVWFDEEIIDPEWYPELSARLVDRHGKFVWSATPQAATEHLFELHKRAEEGDRLVEEIVVLLRDNAHISQQDKLDFIQKMSPEQRRVRIEGEFAILGHLVYPEYSKLIHNCDWFHIPDTWTRLLAIDPGRQVCAVLFAAVPPGEKHIYFYDELYIRQCDAERLGERLKEKTNGQRFHVFLIDGRAARQTEMGSGVTVESRYLNELRKHKLRSELNGFGFTWGSDDVDAGLLAFRSWLRIRPDGTTKLRVLRGSCPEFENEIERYHYQRVQGRLTDKPIKAHDHLMDCARYIAAYGPTYHKPKKPKKRESDAVRMLKAKREREAFKRRQEHGGGRHVHLGPGRF